jgi:hypothetical protein
VTLVKFPQGKASDLCMRVLRSTPEEEIIRWCLGDDTKYLDRALLEYRKSSWDDADFGDLPSEAQHKILCRAQEMKIRATHLHAGC